MFFTRRLEGTKNLRSLFSFTASFLRRQESRKLSGWIPAFAGMAIIGIFLILHPAWASEIPEDLRERIIADENNSNVRDFDQIIDSKKVNLPAEAGLYKHLGFELECINTGYEYNIRAYSRIKISEDEHKKIIEARKKFNLGMAQVHGMEVTPDLIAQNEKLSDTKYTGYNIIPFYIFSANLCAPRKHMETGETIYALGDTHEMWDYTPEKFEGELYCVIVKSKNLKPPCHFGDKPCPTPPSKEGPKEIMFRNIKFGNVFGNYDPKKTIEDFSFKF